MINQSPMVSIIIPTFNRAALLPRAVRSVLEQTFANVEVLVIDDDSTDNTEAVIKSIGDARIRYFKVLGRQGAAVCRNTGIRNARGKYIAFQDSDDEWFPDKLERQLDLIEKCGNNIGMVYSGFWRYELNGKRYYVPDRTLKMKGNIYKELLVRNFITTQSVLIRSSCFERTGIFDENLPRFQDWELFIRISKDYEIEFIDVPLLAVYIQKDSITRNKTFQAKARALILKRHYNEIASDKGLLSRHYYFLGLSFCDFGEMKKGRYYYYASIRSNPLHLKSYLAFVVSFMGERIFSFLLNMRNELKRAAFTGRRTKDHIRNRSAK